MAGPLGRKIPLHRFAVPLPIFDREERGSVIFSSPFHGEVAGEVPPERYP